MGGGARERETEKETDRQTDRQRNRDGQTDRDRDKERHTERGWRGRERCAENGDMLSEMYTQTAERIHWNNNVLTGRKKERKRKVPGRGCSCSDVNGSERRGESA